nr:hypothetical protein CFP56_60490 [Quercus suber]
MFFEWRDAQALIMCSKNPDSVDTAVPPDEFPDLVHPVLDPSPHHESSFQPEFPIVQPDLPVVQSVLPNVQPDLPVVQSALPNVQPDLPVVQSALPNVQPASPFLPPFFLIITAT